MPEASDAMRRHGARDFLDGLDTWTLGVLLTWTVDADWGSGVLTLEVPDLVAERLLSPVSSLPCSPAAAAPDLPEPDRSPGRQPGIVRPGVFDDTPVFDRRPVTLDHIHALHTLGPAADELYLVFSASGGAEVLPLDTIEKRLAKGWLGVLIAGARDLPGSVLGLQELEQSPEPEAREAQLPGRGQGVHDPNFGEGLGLAEGTRRTLRQTYAIEDRNLTLRLLALARGAHDLRSLDAGQPGGLPVAVWHGLLTEDRLSLAPFRQPAGECGVRPAVDLDGSRVGLVNAGKDLHERRLAGSVHAHQRVDLARVQVEVHTLQRGGSAEALGDAPYAKEGIHGRGRSAPGTTRS